MIHIDDITFPWRMSEMKMANKLPSQIQRSRNQVRKDIQREIMNTDTKGG
jgi:hypothetical protein